MYGTLRRGGVRALPSLFPEAQFLGFGMIRGWLYDFGDFPGLLFDPEGEAVIGEVYRISTAALKQIDAIEEWNPQAPQTSLYFRRWRAVELRDGGQVEAWVYECNPAHLPCTKRIPGGDWIAFVSAHAHH